MTRHLVVIKMAIVVMPCHLLFQLEMPKKKKLEEEDELASSSLEKQKD